MERPPSSISQGRAARRHSAALPSSRTAPRPEGSPQDLVPTSLKRGKSVCEVYLPVSRVFGRANRRGTAESCNYIQLYYLLTCNDVPAHMGRPGLLRSLVVRPSDYFSCTDSVTRNSYMPHCRNKCKNYPTAAPFSSASELLRVRLGYTTMLSSPSWRALWRPPPVGARRRKQSRWWAQRHPSPPRAAPWTRAARGAQRRDLRACRVRATRSLP